MKDAHRMTVRERRALRSGVLAATVFIATFLSVSGCKMTPLLSAVEQRVQGTESTSRVNAPRFTPQPGTFATGQSVTIDDTTPGATIRYTTDGTMPSENVGAIYTGAITISSSETLKAIAYESGMADSSVASGDYTITSSSTGFTMSGGLLGDYSVTFTVNQTGSTPTLDSTGEYPVWSELSQGATITIDAQSSPAATSWQWILDGVQQSSITSSVVLPAGLSVQKHYLTLKLKRGSDPYRSATIVLDVTQFTGGSSFTLTGGLLSDYAVTFTVGEPGVSPTLDTSGEYPVWSGLSTADQITVGAVSTPAATTYVWILDGVQQSSTGSTIVLPTGLSVQKHYLTLELKRGSDPYRSATAILEVDH